MAGKFIGSTTMEPGTYYIGDLCYVIQGQAWQELVDLCYPDDETDELQGVFQLSDGRKLAIYSTAHGDGTYPAYDSSSSTSGECPVDSGSVGCIRVEDISADSKDMTRHGLVYEFTKPFTVYESAGTIVFGPINVSTDLSDDYDDDEDYNDEEE